MPPKPGIGMGPVRVPAQGQGHTDAASSWPVYKMQYRMYGGGNKELRLEWNHSPDDASLMETIGAIRGYLDNPKRDEDDGPDSWNFNNLQPEFCVVQAGPHKTTLSSTTRAPDKKLHISVRFCSKSQRDRGQGVSVHIYLNEATNKYNSNSVLWQLPSNDKESQYRVHRNRVAWPPGASATEAPWAPGQEPSQRTETPSTLGLKESQPPARPAWSQPLTTSGITGTSTAPPTMQAGSSCPPSCQGIQWSRVVDGTSSFLQGIRRDGTVVRKRGDQYTDEHGNEIAT